MFMKNFQVAAIMIGVNNLWQLRVTGICKYHYLYLPVTFILILNLNIR
jgi:hypothetical protein